MGSRRSNTAGPAKLPSQASDGFDVPAAPPAPASAAEAGSATFETLHSLVRTGGASDGGGGCHEDDEFGSSSSCSAASSSSTASQLRAATSCGGAAAPAAAAAAAAANFPSVFTEALSHRFYSSGSVGASSVGGSAGVVSWRLAAGQSPAGLRSPKRFAGALSGESAAAAAGGTPAVSAASSASALTPSPGAAAAVTVVSLSGDPRRDAIRLPDSVVTEMFRSGGKGTRTMVLFARKHDAVYFTAGLPWLHPLTRAYIRRVLFLQVSVWVVGAAGLLAGVANQSLPVILLPLLLPLLGALQLLGYFALARFLIAGLVAYCASCVVAAGFYVTHMVSAVRTIVLVYAGGASGSGDGDGIFDDAAASAAAAASDSLYFSWTVVTMLFSALAAALCFTLFLATGALWLKMRAEQEEMRILLPTNREVPIPNEVPFLRWYFSAPRRLQHPRILG